MKVLFLITLVIVLIFIWLFDPSPHIEDVYTLEVYWQIPHRLDTKAKEAMANMYQDDTWKSYTAKLILNGYIISKGKRVDPYCYPIRATKSQIVEIIEKSKNVYDVFGIATPKCIYECKCRWNKGKIGYSYFQVIKVIS